MRSHLTRNVFRRILASEPILHRECLHQQSTPYSSSVRPTIYSNGRFMLRHRQQHRALGGFNFNIFSNRQEKKEADMGAGIDKMMELDKKARMQARLPPRREIALAFRQLFESKAQRKYPLTDTESQLALQSLRYLLEEENSVQDTLPDPVIHTASRVLRSTYASQGPTNVELSRLLYERVQHSPESDLYNFLFLGYIHALCHDEQATLARDLVLQHEKNLSPGGKPHSSGESEGEMNSNDTNREENELESQFERGRAIQYDPSSAWRTLLQGFVNERKGDEVESTVATIQERGFTGQAFSRIMIQYSLQQNDASDAIRRWWKAYKNGSNHRRGGLNHKTRVGSTVLLEILNWCRANGQLEMGHDIVRDVMKNNPPKLWWDVIFIWAAGTNKGVDEIERMMKVMEDSNATVRGPANLRVPDIETINGLVEFAISVNDPYMAERFIALGRDRNLQPDARTFVLQMDYRLNVKDINGALIAYKNLQSHDTSNDEDVPIVNRLLAALCRTHRHDFETIMNVAADLSDRQARFEADTVAALSILHLSRDEEDDVIDLLNTHAFHYSSAERASIRNTILGFSLDSATPTARAWTGYTVLRDVFDELARKDRTQLMSAFFDRDRPDMAVHVFQNMRMHSRADTIPSLDTYVVAFMGLAKAHQLDGLEVVHNQLKLDYNINPTTYLYNSLIIAYTACGKARLALNFWDDIVVSREGPTYNSIHAALRACEKDAWGDVRAKKIWDTLKKRDVDLDQALWASYVAALAGNGDTELAINKLEEGVEKGEVEVDSFILGSLHDVAVVNMKQAEVENFARQKYPAAWEKLEETGSRAEEDGRKKFRIDRKIGP